ncbi:MAG: tRNA pseudouridine(55) synthase TruB [Opitutae bacterium]|nr:tRNA pseudouridine(55) synthase TruB [Opitutae bacterium]|tara:strand:- start:3665 stop:4399 length:735 start_codon:yes stop_codon:yes gene_type:complete
MSTSPNNQYEGVLLVDKPTGMTSHDVVDRLRRKFQMRRIGHAGTLDPNATGLLIMLIGKATKISQFLISLDKTYEGVIRFGQSTNTQDVDGEILEEKEIPEDLDEDALRNAMKEFLGDQYQTPPMFSAKKVDGVPLYKMARKGKSVEREPRFIRINSFELSEPWVPPNATFSMTCSKGTYVRTVAHDLGQNLGCGAHLDSLRRTRIDEFDLAEAHSLEEISEMGHAQLKDILIPAHQAVPPHVL